jgi:hypothetical protein
MNPEIFHPQIAQIFADEDAGGPVQIVAPTAENEGTAAPSKIICANLRNLRISSLFKC